ncbi:hypothetical protein GpartN1_g744.t1 [Galdieria partita]|uniref:Uncharacterized protein n=1 Tax=Galdieria partita TaxID=83374 RepID=A0A9C7PQU0_9RHOD|nr:hypothetical protein GpartN1_g744.t1 [Galdieria partita]
MMTDKWNSRFFCQGSFKRCYENGCQFIIPRQISELVLVRCPSSEPIEVFSHICVCMKKKCCFEEWIFQYLAKENRVEEGKRKENADPTGPKKKKQGNKCLGPSQASTGKVKKKIQKKINPTSNLKSEDNRVNKDAERNVGNSTLDNLLLLSRIASNF